MSFLSLDLFSLTFENILWLSYNRPPPPVRICHWSAVAAGHWVWYGSYSLDGKLFIEPVWCRCGRVWLLRISQLSASLTDGPVQQETAQRLPLLSVVREQQLSRLYHRETLLERPAVSRITFVFSISSSSSSSSVL